MANENDRFIQYTVLLVTEKLTAAAAVIHSTMSPLKATQNSLLSETMKDGCTL